MPGERDPSAFITCVMANAREERIKTYSDALRRFAEWFNRFRKSDGSLDAPNLSCPAYMPVPLYAHAIGDTDRTDFAHDRHLVSNHCSDRDHFRFS